MTTPAAANKMRNTAEIDQDIENLNSQENIYRAKAVKAHDIGDYDAVVLWTKAANAAYDHKRVLMSISNQLYTR